MKYLFYSLIILLLTTGCSHHYSVNKKQLSSSHSTYRAKPSASRLKELYQYYKNWKGTPYRYGGNTKRGIDCSSFILDTYQSLFKIPLPRSTKDQVKQGSRIYINQLEPGDLVFFKTGWNVRHVGVYLEKGKFMHVSSKRGVIISTLNSGYWKESYWQARRLL